jgi:tRNA/rRNA methyltransferase
VRQAAARIRFVLVAPSHPGNIGASARALATMGFARLVVVDPKHADFRAQEAARALAVGAVAVLDGATHCERLEQALDGVTLAFAMTGYDREFGPPLRDLRSAAASALAHAAETGAEVAFVFGTERAGLSNRDVARCQYCCAIPASDDHPSLNLAQAVQVTAYECRMAALTAPSIRPASAVSPASSNAPGRSSAAALPLVASRFAPEKPAAVAALDLLFDHLGRALVALGVIDPSAPRKTMARLRRLLLRAAPSGADVALLRGIAAAVIEPKAERAGAGRPQARRAAELDPSSGSQPSRTIDE